MIRHASAVALVLCLNASPLFAQTTGPQRMEFTVKTEPANVHKAPTVASAVITKAQIGTVLEITRHLGSWVQVPWPGAEGGVAFLHVNGGSIARRSLTEPAAPVAGGTSLQVAPTSPAAPGARHNQITSAAEPAPRRVSYILLPDHNFGLGGQLRGSTPGFGATARGWWGDLGVQFDVSRYRLDNVNLTERLTSTHFTPSLLYALPNAVTNSFWVRPYVGGGANFYRSTVSTRTTLPTALAIEKGMEFQTFGGGEATFAAVPQFSLSADVGYRWKQKSVAGFEPERVGFSLSGHWYIK